MTAGPVALRPQCGRGGSPTHEGFSLDVAKDDPSLCRPGGCSRAQVGDRSVSGVMTTDRVLPSAPVLWEETERP